MISWFWVFVFGIIFLVLWVGFKNIVVPSIFLLLVLAQWGHLIPAYAYDFIQIALIFSVGAMLFKAFAPKLTN